MESYEILYRTRDGKTHKTATEAQAHADFLRMLDAAVPLQADYTNDQAYEEDCGAVETGIRRLLAAGFRITAPEASGG